MAQSYNFPFCLFARRSLFIVNSSRFNLHGTGRLFKCKTSQSRHRAVSLLTEQGDFVPLLLS